jgi:hypothetical protein
MSCQAHNTCSSRTVQHHTAQQDNCMPCSGCEVTTSNCCVILMWQLYKAYRR